MVTVPVLALPNLDKALVVESDASNAAAGAVLLQQKPDGIVHPIQYGSREINVAQKKCFACVRETIVITFALRKF